MSQKPEDWAWDNDEDKNDYSNYTSEISDNNFEEKLEKEKHIDFRQEIISHEMDSDCKIRLRCKENTE